MFSPFYAARHCKSCATSCSRARKLGCTPARVQSAPEKGKEPMRSHRFHLNVTEKCNIRCVHCYWEAYGKHPDPSLETIDQILAKFKALGKAYGEHGRHMLTIGGGEPTIRKDLTAIIRLAVRRRFRVRLVTNAVMITDTMARSLKKAGLRLAQVSLDGA